MTIAFVTRGRLCSGGGVVTPPAVPAFPGALICPEFVETVTVTRTDAATYDADGKRVDGSTSTFDIEASIQPLTGKELQALPEGQHGENVRVVYTITELRTRQPGNDPDTVDISGETWEVIQVEFWDHFEESHYRVRIARQDLP